MKKIYNTAKINQLYQSVESHLTSSEQETIKEIVGSFNDLIKCAIKQKKTIDRREGDWLNESKNNNKLRLDVEDLKESIMHRDNVIKGLRSEIKVLKKQIAENNKRKTR